MIESRDETKPIQDTPDITPKNVFQCMPLVSTNCKLNNFNNFLESKMPTKKYNCSALHQNRCIQKESFSCDSINNSRFIPLAGPYNDDSDKKDTIQATKQSLNTCSSIVNPSTISATSSGAGAALSPIFSLSKSETNISESNTEESQLSIHNVVSLNNLHDSEQYFNRTLNDISKNQCHEDLSSMKHIVTLTNPNIFTTVTVSMRNAADVSDKVF